MRTNKMLAGGSSMDCINQIKEKLKKYPDLRWELDGSTISVSPENGFTVWLVESEQGCTVGYNGWHEEFSDKNEALNCFAFGLSEQCRLKVFLKGKTEYKWVMEALEDGIWVSHSTTGIFFYPYWRKTKISYLQNHVISS
ncbi:hypothetical protein [Shewanella mangrovisoli]|uniref:hypothetical protein n=1 Tax=Shewanella mangrovisoli TaxID=2864211 RepID=UPI0035BAE92F